MLLRRPHDLAQLLREARLRAGLSQQDLAEKVGASRQWISLVENGKTTVEFDLVVGVLQALGYRLFVEPPNETLTSEAQPPRTPLTRHGEPLGKQRTRRRPKGPGNAEQP